MKTGTTGVLWEAGDKVLILRDALEEPHRSNRRLDVDDDGYCAGEVTAIDDARRKVQIALRIKGRSFVIGVGEMLPKAWVESNAIVTYEDAHQGADADEQFNPKPWLVNITHKVLVQKDIRLPSGIVLFEAGFIYFGRSVEEPSWGVSGFDLFCPATRKFHFCDSEVTAMMAEEVQQ